jgi:hypothetical protein
MRRALGYPSPGHLAPLKRSVQLPLPKGIWHPFRRAVGSLFDCPPLAQSTSCQQSSWVLLPGTFSCPLKENAPCPDRIIWLPLAESSLLAITRVCGTPIPRQRHYLSHLQSIWHYSQEQLLSCRRHAPVPTCSQLVAIPVPGCRNPSPAQSQ